MSFFILANYFMKEASINEQVHQLVDIVAKLIEENNRLKELSKNKLIENYRHALELFMLMAVYEQKRSERLAQRTALTAARLAYGNFLQLSQQLHSCELEKVAAYNMQQQQQQLQTQYEELQQYNEEQLELLRKMENRKIVQQLRQTQHKAAIIEAQLNEQKTYMARKKANILRKINAAKTTRNMKIVCLVRNWKDCQLMEERTTIWNEHKFKQQEEKPHVNLQSALTDRSTQPKMLNFLKTFIMELPKVHQNESTQPMLRSILRKDSRIPDERVLWPISMKQVTFKQPVCSVQSISPNRRTKTKNTKFHLKAQMEELNKEIVVEITDATVRADKPIERVQQQEILETVDLTTQQSSNAKEKVQIIDCRVVKPAGTVLPKAIPIDVSPDGSILPTTSLNAESIQTTASSKRLQRKYNAYMQKFMRETMGDDFQLQLNKPNPDVEPLIEQQAAKTFKNKRFENFYMNESVDSEQPVEFTDSEIMGFDDEILDDDNDGFFMDLDRTSDECNKDFL